jgi:predicted PurR-regulated permease PerM
VLLAGISAALAWAVFMVIGLPFALALAIWMAVLSQFVPVVGTYIGGALPLVIALLESPGSAGAVLIYVFAYQQIENYLLAPRITARTMSLHPAISFGSAIAGGTLLGVPGALMALPVAATTQAFVSTYLERHTVIESPLTEDPTAYEGG